MECYPAANRGSRVALEDKLIQWHRLRQNCRNVVRRPGQSPSAEVNLVMNVVGNNFAILPVSVRGRKGGRSRKRRESVLAIGSGESNTVVVVSPTVLRPLAKSPREVTSVLKGRRVSVTPNRLERITFSPFNGVKVIPHRFSEVYLSPTGCELDDEDSDSDDDSDE